MFCIKFCVNVRCKLNLFGARLFIIVESFELCGVAWTRLWLLFSLRLVCSARLNSTQLDFIHSFRSFFCMLKEGYDLIDALSYRIKFLFIWRGRICLENNNNNLC